jgi:hypothetical protein
MKLPSAYTDLCFKQVFENATVVSNSRCRSGVISANCELQLPMNVSIPAGSKSCIVNCMLGSQRGVYDNLKAPLTP